MGYTTSKIVRIIINIFTTFTSFFPHFLNPTISLLHLMRVITNAHTSTHTTSLMHKRYHLPLLFVTLNCLGHWNEETERTNNKSNLIVDHFSLTFVNSLLA